MCNLDRANARVFALLLTLGTAFLAVPAGGAANLEKVLERGVLEVAVYDNFPPFAYRRNGRTTGIDVDIGKALARKLGVSVSVRVIGADETMEDDLRNNVWKGHYLGGGTADVMLHVPVDPAFAEENDRVYILGPYYREEVVIARNPSRIPNMASLEVFTQEKVGVELDTLADFYLLSAFGGQFRSNVVHFRSVREAAAAMMADEVSAVMGPRSEVEAGLGDRQGDFPLTQVQMQGMRQGGWDLGMAVKAGNEALADALEKAMQEMREDGTVERIFAEHGVSYRGPSGAALAYRAPR